TRKGDAANTHASTVSCTGCGVLGADSSAPGDGGRPIGRAHDDGGGPALVRHQGRAPAPSEGHAAGGRDPQPAAGERAAAGTGDGIAGTTCNGERPERT